MSLRVYQDFSALCNHRCSGNSKGTRIRSGTWKCNWIYAIYHKIVTDGKLYFMNEQSVSLCGICSWWKWSEIVEVTINDLEYYNKGFMI